jgi:hypothetical protein
MLVISPTVGVNARTIIVIINQGLLKRYHSRTSFVAFARIDVANIRVCYSSFEGCAVCGI